MLTVGHVLWLVFVQFPLAVFPVTVRPRDRHLMLRERMPWKKSAAPIERNPSRYVVYLVWRIVPMSVFCAGMFLWQATQAGFDLTWTTESQGGSLNVVAVQSVGLVSIVWTSCVLAMSFASRTDPEWSLEWGFYWYWGMATVSAVLLQLMYNCAYAQAAVGACRDAFAVEEVSCSSCCFVIDLSAPGYGREQAVWLVMMLVPLVVVPLLAWPAKQHDKKHFRHAMQMLRLTFETKLGQ